MLTAYTSNDQAIEAEISPDAGEPPSDTTEPPTAAITPEHASFLEEMFRFFKQEAAHERNARTAIEAIRADDQKEFNDQLETLHDEHRQQKAELLDELTTAYNLIFSLKDSNARLTAAYHEAKAKLPADTELTESLIEADHVSQTKFMPAIKPDHVKFGKPDTDNHRNTS